MHPATRAYCDFLLAVTYSGYPAQITAIWALERTYLESWDSARPGAHPYRDFVNRWTTDGFRSYVGDLQSSVDRQLQASVGVQSPRRCHPARRFRAPGPGPASWISSPCATDF
jgi:thiaminase